MCVCAGVLAVIVGQILWYVVSIVVDSLITNYPDKFSLWVHVVTCLWPSIALMWVLDTVNNFQRNGESELQYRVHRLTEHRLYRQLSSGHHKKRMLNSLEG